MRDFKNWWYYHKNYVLVAVLIAAAAVHFVYGKLTQVHPDLTVAIISEGVIPAQSAARLKELLTAKCGDYNRDGRVTVQINAYGDPNADALGVEGGAYKTATEAELIGDITACESYLFVTDDPVYLQRGYQILALPDGSCPADTDYSVEGKIIPLSFLFGGVDRIEDDFLSTCSIGRRCFYNEKTCENLEDCKKLWESFMQDI